MERSEAHQWLEQADLLNRRRLALEAECRESLRNVDEQIAAASHFTGTLSADCSAIHVDAALLDSERSESCAQLFAWIDRVRQRPVPSKTLDLAKALAREQASLAAVANVLAGVESEAKRILALSEISTSQRVIEEGRRAKAVTSVALRSKPKTPPTSSTSPAPSAADRHADFLTMHGGSSLGWPDDDHMTFLRCIMNRTEREPMALFDDLQAALPHLDASNIGNHLSLYHQHLQLVEEKRKEIALFRLEKEATRAEEGELESIRREAELQQEHLEALRKERQRLEHHQTLHKKLDAWREMKKSTSAVTHRTSSDEVLPRNATTRSRLRAAPLKPPSAAAAPPPPTTDAREAAAKTPHGRSNSAVIGSRAASSGGQRAPASASTDRPQTAHATANSISLQRRWEEDRRRVVERAGKIDCKRALASTSRSDVLYSLADHTVSAVASSQVPSDRQRVTRLTESATQRRCASASGGGGARERCRSDVVARDNLGAWYLTPRNSSGAHLASAAWCPKTYQR